MGSFVTYPRLNRQNSGNCTVHNTRRSPDVQLQAAGSRRYDEREKMGLGWDFWEDVITIFGHRASNVRLLGMVRNANSNEKRRVMASIDISAKDSTFRRRPKQRRVGTQESQYHLTWLLQLKRLLLIETFPGV